MADRKEGTLEVNATKDRGYGYVHVDGEKRKVFVHVTDLRGLKTLNDGDRISFEESAPDPTRRNQTKAINTIVLAPRSSSSPTPVPVPASSPPTSPPVQPQAIEVDWNPGTPTSHSLPLTLILTSGKQLLAGVEVTLKANGIDVVQPSPKPSTSKGKVAFLMPFTPKTQVYALAASYEEGGKTKVATSIWEKRKKKLTVSPPVSTTATPATDAEKKLPEIEVVNPPRDPDPTTGAFLVNVVTRKDGKLANRDFTPLSDRTVEIQQSHPAGLAVVTTFTPDTIGHFPLYINFDGIIAKIVFKLDNGQEAVVWLSK